jgi:hypothetical protein
MMYVVMDQTKTDLFNTECATLDEAIKEADKQFAYLTNAEKKQRTAFFVLESVDPDEDSERHFDGDIIKQYI